MLPIGILHLASAAVALLSGTIVIATKKGTQLHKRLGYLYFYSMLYMNGSALLIYRLTGQFNGFHMGAIISFITILIGIGTLYFRGTKPSSINLHLATMYWSLVGLYSAFFSETLTRLSTLPFVWAVIIPTAIVSLLGAIVFVKQVKIWSRKG